MSDLDNQDVEKPAGPMYINQSKKYGLIIPSKTKIEEPKTKPKQTVKPCIFDEDDDEEVVDSKSKNPIQRQVNTNSSLLKKQTQIQIEQALQEDKNVFEYDEIYDQLEKEKQKIDPKAKKNDSKEPKYIVGIMKAAAKRKMEYERIQERKIQKEREEEGDLWSDKEVFVTTAYRKKMEERQKMDEEERKQEQIENLLDVRKQKDLSGFYYSMLKMRTGELVVEEEGEKEKRLERERLEATKFKESKSGQQKTYRSNKEESDEEEELAQTEVKQEESVEFKEPEAKKVKETEDKENVKVEDAEVKEVKDIKEEPKVSKEERRRLRLENLFKKRTVGQKLDEELSEYFQRKAILAQKLYIERE